MKNFDNKYIYEFLLKNRELEYLEETSITLDHKIKEYGLDESKTSLVENIGSLDNMVNELQKELYITGGVSDTQMIILDNLIKELPDIPNLNIFNVNITDSIAVVNDAVLKEIESWDSLQDIYGNFYGKLLVMFDKIPGSRSNINYDISAIGHPVFEALEKQFWIYKQVVLEMSDKLSKIKEGCIRLIDAENVLRFKKVSQIQYTRVGPETSRFTQDDRDYFATEAKYADFRCRDATLKLDKEFKYHGYDDWLETAPEMDNDDTMQLLRDNLEEYPTPWHPYGFSKLRMTEWHGSYEDYEGGDFPDRSTYEILKDRYENRELSKNMAFHDADGDDLFANYTNPRLPLEDDNTETTGNISTWELGDPISEWPDDTGYTHLEYEYDDTSDSDSEILPNTDIEPDTDFIDMSELPFHEAMEVIGTICDLL